MCTWDMNSEMESHKAGWWVGVWWFVGGWERGGILVVGVEWFVGGKKCGGWLVGVSVVGGLLVGGRVGWFIGGG